jgi:hypothetical protein
MRKVVVMSWDNSNMAGFEWTCEVFVTQRKDGTFSVGARMSSNDGGARLRGRYRLKTGSQVKSAIDDLFNDDLLIENTPDWDEIASHIATLDRRLATQLRAAVDHDDAEDESEDASNFSLTGSHVTSRRRILFSSNDGRLYMTTGRRTKAEEDELYKKLDGIVAFTSRSAGSRAPSGAMQPPSPEAGAQRSPSQ